MSVNKAEVKIKQLHSKELEKVFMQLRRAHGGNRGQRMARMIKFVNEGPEQVTAFTKALEYVYRDQQDYVFLELPQPIANTWSNVIHQQNALAVANVTVLFPMPQKPEGVGAFVLCVWPYSALLEGVSVPPTKVPSAQVKFNGRNIIVKENDIWFALPDGLFEDENQIEIDFNMPLEDVYWAGFIMKVLYVESAKPALKQVIPKKNEDNLISLEQANIIYRREWRDTIEDDHTRRMYDLFPNMKAPMQLPSGKDYRCKPLIKIRSDNKHSATDWKKYYFFTKTGRAFYDSRDTAEDYARRREERLNSLDEAYDKWIFQRAKESWNSKVGPSVADPSVS